MELIGSLLLILAVALVVGLFISRPFLEGGALQDRSVRDQAGAREHDISALLAERDRVLTALQELDFDNAMGKVPEDEYPRQRAALLRTGAEVLRRLDLLQAEHQPAADRTVEDRIEAAVAARRADAAAAGSAAAVRAPAAVAAKPNGSARGDALEDLIANRKRSRKESSAGFCPKCGRPVQKSDSFCSRCGTTL